ncbi:MULTISPECIES: hypothetical protein [unclassified Rathayibacter]|jgi:septal ring factor EnvC (AmiA/AmiB activator)|uniref:hypothetical protein n=1 Tax=unclassified Rathayibacter TaxID=2609250 RepID=UPI000F4CC818|nr:MULTISPECIES: hypothetical protein [unclassified Rathayibacter]ROP45156.1 hypothetical protein EDF45_3674 [Rathayibacter sp. PhB186]ROS47807.1 hypothetical protein EDF44_3640 [Rathayibacter sp. PhB185]TCL81865.1 hypothetical protein EDF49_107226 [Rathayibacter sp. PhB192]TCM26874.1 hypothetical protein EDF43_107226 [Rathayibacter sp. PhB179]
MTDDHDFRADPASAPTRFGRGGVALREAVHRMVAPYFEQARLRTEEVREEVAAVRGELAGLRDELAAVRAETAALREETAGLRAALDEDRAALAELRRETEESLAVTPPLLTAGESRTADLEERVRGAELELRAVTRRLAEALDAAD